MSKQENLDYLKNQDCVIIPENYTYWVHNETFNLPEYKGRYDASWEAIPTKEFTAGKNMKCESAYDIFRDMVHHKRKKPMSMCITPSGSLPFRIVIVQPRHNHLADICSADDLKLRYYEEDGLGEFRQPKVAEGTKFVVFACKNRDEKENEPDIIYAVREQDLADYVAELKKVQEKNIKFDKSKEKHGFEINWERGTVKEPNMVKILFGKPDFRRFESTYIGTKETGLVAPAPYVEEFVHDSEERLKK